MAKKETKKTTKGAATKSEIKHAEWLYVEKGISPQAIADELERNIKTIYEWRDKYEWDDTKDLFTTGPAELKKTLLQAAMRNVNGITRKNEKGEEIKEVDADSLSKVMKAYDYISKKASPAVVRDVLVELDKFVCEREPKLAAQMTQYHKMFLTFKIRQENGN